MGYRLEKEGISFIFKYFFRVTKGVRYLTDNDCNHFAAGKREVFFIRKGWGNELVLY